MGKHIVYFTSVVALFMLSGCASNKFNEYWETTSVSTTQIKTVQQRPEPVAKEEDRSVETFKVEMPESQAAEKVTVESSLSEGEEIVIIK